MSPAKPEVVLGHVAHRLNQNYRRLAPELHGARVFFYVGDGEEATECWTMFLDRRAPRLYRGFYGKAPKDDLFLQVQVTSAELTALFTGDETLRPDLKIEGNSEALYLALGACL